MECPYCLRSCEHNGYEQNKPTVKNEVCPIVKQFNQVQAEIMQKHLEKHKYYRHIKDEIEAFLDFNKEFAPIEREVVCGVCIHHKNCLVEEEVLK